MNQSDLPQQSNSSYPPVLPTSTLAIISLIAGICGFTILPMLGGIVALITGTMARGETRSVPPRAAGDGLATAGIVLGIIQLAMVVVGICCVIIYFVFVVGIVMSSGAGGH